MTGSSAPTREWPARPASLERARLRGAGCGPERAATRRGRGAGRGEPWSRRPPSCRARRRRQPPPPCSSRSRPPSPAAWRTLRPSRRHDRRSAPAAGLPGRAARRDETAWRALRRQRPRPGSREQRVERGVGLLLNAALRGAALRADPRVSLKRAGRLAGGVVVAGVLAQPPAAKLGVLLELAFEHPPLPLGLVRDRRGNSQNSVGRRRPWPLCLAFPRRAGRRAILGPGTSAEQRARGLARPTVASGCARPTRRARAPAARFARSAGIRRLGSARASGPRVSADRR